MLAKTMMKKPKIHIWRGYPINSVVRSVVHGMGYRFRLDDEELPGRPHLVFRALKLVMFTVDCSDYPHADCTVPRWRQPGRRDQEVNSERLAIVERVFGMRGFHFACFRSCHADDRATLKRRLDEALQGARAAVESGTHT